MRGCMQVHARCEWRRGRRIGKAAIDRALDPDSNGDLSDRADVINLSLNSHTEHNPNDGWSLEADAAAQLGCNRAVAVWQNNGAGDSFIRLPMRAKGIAVGAVGY